MTIEITLGESRDAGRYLGCEFDADACEAWVAGAYADEVLARVSAEFPDADVTVRATRDGVAPEEQVRVDDDDHEIVDIVNRLVQDAWERALHNNPPKAA